MSYRITKEFSRFHRESIVDDTARVIETIDIDINQRFLDEDRFHDLSVFCDTATLSSNLKFPGKHLLINCRQLILDEDRVIDTSVNDADLQNINWGAPRLNEHNADFLDEVFKQENKSPEVLLYRIKAQIKALPGSKIVFDDKKSPLQMLNQLLVEPSFYAACLAVPYYNVLLQRESHSLAELEKMTANLRNEVTGISDAAGKPLLKRFNRLVISIIENENCPRSVFIWCDYERNRQAPQGKGASELNTGYNGRDGVKGDDGANGSNGIAAGDVTIIAETIVMNNKATLTIHANGGKGGRGQDGGNGSDGGDATLYQQIITGTSSANIVLANGDKKVAINSGQYIRTEKHYGMGNYSLDMINQAAFENAVAEIIPRGGKGGDGGNAGSSGNGGRGGAIRVYCILNAIAAGERIRVSHTGGAAGAHSYGGRPGNSGESNILRLTFTWLMGGGAGTSRNFDTRKGTVAAGVPGRNAAAAAPGSEGSYSCSQVDYSMLYSRSPASFEYLPCSIPQRLMTFYALKLAYLKKDFARTNILLNWLENVTPHADESATGEIPSDSRTGNAINHNVLLLKNYLACGLDFHGHSLNYTPLNNVEHYTDRITKILTVAKSVESEYNRWQQIASDTIQQASAGKAFVNSENDKLRTLDMGIDELLERKLQIEQTLTDLTRELKAEFKLVEQRSRDFFDNVQSRIGFEMGLGMLNIIAQTVLIATGNVASAKYIGMAGEGIAKLHSYLQEKNAGVDENGEKSLVKNPFLEAASDSLARHAASMKKLEAHQQEKNKIKQALKAEILKQDDETNLTIAIRGVKEKKPETGFVATVKEKGQELGNVVAHVMPIVNEIQNIRAISKDLEECRQQLGFDAVKLAMTKQTYEAMITKFEGYAGKEAAGNFRKAIKKFEQLSRDRNELQLEYTALFIKMQELLAADMLINQEIGANMEQIAINEDPVIRQMSTFWEKVYDYFRDMLLDRIYEEFQAYRYAALSDEPFSIASFSHYIRHDAGMTEGKDIPGALLAVQKIDQLYLNQHVTFIELLHNRVYEMAVRARNAKFGSHAMLEGEAGRIVFRKTEGHRLFSVEKDFAVGVFHIEEDSEKFNKRAYLSFSELRVFVPGVAADNGRVSLKIRHGGQVRIKDKKGKTHEYVHDIPNIVDYEYKVFKAEQETFISRIDRRKIVYQDDREIYVDYITNSLGNDDMYIELNPCTQWTVYLSPKDNPGLKLEDITEVIFQFKARALSMDII
ncbi:MAG TPA: hypothetical protein VFS25_07835 [Chitinophaga sp.]|uniref:hypothetical protein n=1 Tax=Chitinophaga sp. TaxID=1869181 RepID=UPI002DB5DB70|nr:hypothetical protein [Chitinophaga sp.]HEU4552728.1 hypothetical protein [Chitinophaga sp.]